MSIDEIPDLTFPMVKFGAKQEPWDLRVLLFRIDEMPITPHRVDVVNSYPVNAPLRERITLVKRLHDEIVADLVKGKSRTTALTRITQLRNFFKWADGQNIPLRLHDIENTYIKWSEYLINRNRIREICEATVHSTASVVGTLLDRVLDRKHPLLRHTRISKPKDSGRFHKSAGDKLLLTEIATFGTALTSLCAQLSSPAVRSTLPVAITVQGHLVKLWANLEPPGARKRHSPKRKSEIHKRIADLNDVSLRRRSPILNLRLEAELLTFIAQTGMNLAQAFQLELDDFRYTSHLDGYEVRAYKARRSGPVLFEIFSEYRSHFERFLQWRLDWFSETGEKRLFPFVRDGSTADEAPEFHRLRRLFNSLGLKYVGPKALRKARINWFLREMNDPRLVADLAQHDLRTLLRVYAEPHPQLAMVEISRFHQKTDPSFSPPAPGICVSPTPDALTETPSGSPQPDCVTASGCLFCSNHRDIDSCDHVWSLASYRHLKSIELASYRPSQREVAEPFTHPAELSINRLTQKLHFFEESSEVRRLWVRESLARVDEGDYHPLWDGFIRLFEASV
ncbi:site-specific integrase [Burkholderia ubonensis]|uniref:site-specific integrase n=1 Tax=Burkholderia ubonensis TaxID=101571 RepID=UPI000A510B0A|nr:site-specific integrase [Burkholderia ubonensis]